MRDAAKRQTARSIKDHAQRKSKAVVSSANLVFRERVMVVVDGQEELDALNEVMR